MLFRLIIFKPPFLVWQLPPINIYAARRGIRIHLISLKVSNAILDEYRGILSRRSSKLLIISLCKNLFDLVNIDIENTHVPDGSNSNVAEVALSTMLCCLQQISRSSTLGIGHNGHIGFNEPDDHFSKGNALVS